MNNNIISQVDVKYVAHLVIQPKSIDSVKNIRKNIKAYGYLEHVSGALYGIIEQSKDFKDFYNDIKEAVHKRDFLKLIDIHNLLMKYTTSEKERIAVNTFIIMLIHNANKELELYDI